MIEGLVRAGEWLRAMSLAGGGGNALAWCMVLALAALPALGLLWRGRCAWDWLLALCAAELFAGLYLLVNPTLVSSEFPAASFIAMALPGCAGSTLLGWAVLRWLRYAETRLPGQTLARLLTGAAVLAALGSAAGSGLAAMEKIRAVAQANTAPGSVLWPTNAVIAALAVLDCLPSLLGCALLFQGGRLAGALESAPFSEETAALAERVRRLCARAAAAAVLVCMAANLLQFALLSVLRDAHFEVSFPFTTVLLAAALSLLCRYLRRAKAVSDDNDSII